MQPHIVLLPRQNYWAWVRASRDYVIEFGPPLTPDRNTAARYMTPEQVVTFPELGGEDDLVRWFEAEHPAVWLDPVEAATPEAWELALKERVEREDPLYRHDRAITLLWPTDYPVVTQRFGANPQIYTRFGMPGHEGLDIRALTNTNVYCCAEGVVYELHTDPKTHAYGIHVRVRHADGYKTVYGHLAKALVAKGEAVQAGQVIGKADSTGASTASHLHLTLKRDGATARGETKYPKDVIDPTPFLVRPGSKASKALPETAVFSGRCLLGACGRVGAPLEAADLDAARRADLEAVRVVHDELPATLAVLREMRPGLLILAGVTTSFSQAAVPASKFCEAVRRSVAELYRQGVRLFEIHSNPNLQSAGWRRSWQDGEAFGLWFLEVLADLRAVAPEGKFGFPGLSPGSAVPGWQQEAFEFLAGAEQAVAAADWIGVHCQWADRAGMLGTWGLGLVDRYRKQYPGAQLFVTEFFNPSAGVPASVRAQQYLTFYRMLRRKPGVGAAFSYALSALSGHEALVWRREDGSMTEFPERIGARAF